MMNIKHCISFWEGACKHRVHWLLVQSGRQARNDRRCPVSLPVGCTEMRIHHPGKIREGTTESSYGQQRKNIPKHNTAKASAWKKVAFPSARNHLFLTILQSPTPLINQNVWRCLFSYPHIGRPHWNSHYINLPSSPWPFSAFLYLPVQIKFCDS